MAFPKEFKYESEDDFVQKLLIPLLHRLGFSLVVNYHGSAELGKDLVFADIDRFGHIRYHGLQAKYVPSISLNAIEELITDCKQAFENPFIHPQTGAKEQISSFYAVNGGSIGSTASDHYFNSVQKLYGANARLLQAKDVLVLDHWATSNYRDSITDILAGLNIEVDYNERHIIPSQIDSLTKLYEGNGTFHLWRLRAEATSDYLKQPFMPSQMEVDNILNYWHLSLLCNKELDLVGQGILAPENRKSLMVQAMQHLKEVNELGKNIKSNIAKVLESLGPIHA